MASPQPTSSFYTLAANLGPGRDFGLHYLGKPGPILTTYDVEVLLRSPLDNVFKRIVRTSIVSAVLLQAITDQIRANITYIQHQKELQRAHLTEKVKDSAEEDQQAQQRAQRRIEEEVALIDQEIEAIEARQKTLEERKSELQQLHNQHQTAILKVQEVIQIREAYCTTQVRPALDRALEEMVEALIRAGFIQEGDKAAWMQYLKEAPNNNAFQQLEIPHREALQEQVNTLINQLSEDDVGIKDYIRQQLMAAAAAITIPQTTRPPLKLTPLPPPPVPLPAPKPGTSPAQDQSTGIPSATDQVTRAVEPIHLIFRDTFLINAMSQFELFITQFGDHLVTKNLSRQAFQEATLFLEKAAEGLAAFESMQGSSHQVESSISMTFSPSAQEPSPYSSSNHREPEETSSAHTSVISEGR